MVPEASSLTFGRQGDDGLQVVVAVRQRDGRLEELAFDLTRVHEDLRDF